MDAVTGQNTIALNVVKRANSNVIQAIANTKAVTEEFRQNLPARVGIFYSQDQAPYAESQVVELEGNILTALCLVMVIVVAAMGIRSGLIVGFGIPASFLFSLICVEAYSWALGALLLNRMCDGLDGTVARLSQPTDFGGYLDIVCDFIFYAFVPFCFAVTHPENAVVAAFLMLSFVGTGNSSI